MEKNLCLGLMIAGLAANLYAQEKPPAVATDLSKDKVAYVVTDAHLDTQWLYDIQRTATEFVPKTLRKNFALFEKYPGFVFNFEGAYRYYLAKENYPLEYAQLKTYIEKGNWAVARCQYSISGIAHAPIPLRQWIFHG